jgi:hypothetical protein
MAGNYQNMILRCSLQLLLVVQCTSINLAKINNETTALQFIIDHDETFGILWNLFYKSAWAYFTNVTEENRKDMVSISTFLISIFIRKSMIKAKCC